MNALINKFSPFSIVMQPQPAPPPDPVKPPSSKGMPIPGMESPVPQPGRLPCVDPDFDLVSINDPTPPRSWRPVAWCQASLC